MPDQNVFLVEIDYRYEAASPAEPLVGTLRLANIEFFDDVNGYVYAEALNSIPNFSRSLSGDRLGVYQSSLGSVEIDNADGEFDYVLTLAIDGSEVRVYRGNKTLPRSGFTHLFSALSQKASAPSLDRISIQLRDTLLLLNKSIGGTYPVGGTGPNADRQRPVDFGYVHQLELLVYDSSVLQYVFSDTPDLVTVLAVRDRGTDVSYTDNLDGTVTLDAGPDGTITADLVGYSPGSPPTGSTLTSDAMHFFVGQRAGLLAAGLFYGAHSTFTVGDDDDYPLGITLPEARNVIDLLQDIVDSGNCFWAVRRTGEFTFGRLSPHDIAGFSLTPVELETDDIDAGTLKIDHIEPKYYKLQAFMNRNWSVQSDLASSLTPDQRATFSRKGFYLIQGNSVGSGYVESPQLYDLTLEISPPIDTLLSEATDDSTNLNAWMERRRVMTLPWLEVISMTVGIEFYELELGDVVNLTLSRFGCDAGVLFQIIAIDMQLTKEKIGLQMIRRRALVEGPDVPPPTVFFLDNFSGSGDFSTHLPDVGGAYISDRGRPLTGYPLSGSGTVQSWTSGYDDLLSPIVGIPGATYTMELLFTVTLVGGSNESIELIAVFDPLGADAFLVDGFLLYDGVTWNFEAWIFSSTNTQLYNSSVDVMASILVGTQQTLRTEVTPSGVVWKLDGVTLLSTSSVPDVPPTYIGFDNDGDGLSNIDVDSLTMTSG